MGACICANEGKAVKPVDPRSVNVIKMKAKCSLDLPISLVEDQEGSKMMPVAKSLIEVTTGEPESLDTEDSDKERDNSGISAKKLISK